MLKFVIVLFIMSLLRGENMELLSLVGNICSIAGLILSIWLLIRTGKIQKNVDNALARKNKILNYTKMRKNILEDITACAAFLINEHTPEEQLPYIQKLDGCLADLATYHPDLDEKTNKKIENIRSSCTGRRFSYIEIIKPLNDIISILKKEEILYYD